MEKQIKTENFNIYIKDGIIYGDILTKNFTLDIVEEMIKARHELTEGKLVPILADLKDVKNMPREARQRMSEKDAGKGTYCVAIVINSKVQVVLFNFFNAIYKAPAPTKLFTDRNKAETWIKKQKQNMDKKLPPEIDKAIE